MGTQIRDDNMSFIIVVTLLKGVVPFSYTFTNCSFNALV